MHPVLFEIGSLPVFSYGVMLGLSLIVAWFVIMRLGKAKEGLAEDTMANCFIVTAVFAIVCSRLLYIATNPQDFESVGDWFAMRTGGLVAYGGFLGGLLGSWLYLRYKKVSLLAWADVVAPTLGSGLGITRIGCYLYGCDFGARLGEDAPGWLQSMGTFPHWSAELQESAGQGSAAWRHHVQEYELSGLSDASFPVHPTQLYESLFGFALFGLLMWLWQRRRFRGQIILTATMLYGVWRFLIEYVRDDPERGFYFGFSTSQLISLGLVPLAAFLYFEMRKRGAPLAASADAPPEAPEDASDLSASKKKRRKKKKR